MKLTFENDTIKESCSGCKVYGEHYIGRTEDNQHAFKCRNCGRLTIWVGGDTEKVVIPGSTNV